jgi:hypothetical protein
MVCTYTCLVSLSVCAWLFTPTSRSHCYQEEWMEWSRRDRHLNEYVNTFFCTLNDMIKVHNHPETITVLRKLPTELCVCVSGIHRYIRHVSVNARFDPWRHLLVSLWSSNNVDCFGHRLLKTHSSSISFDRGQSAELAYPTLSNQVFNLRPHAHKTDTFTRHAHTHSRTQFFPYSIIPPKSTIIALPSEIFFQGK